ncbi:MAG: hypothetical protein M3O68_09520 [Thermoproteota archaeon]|nr:hypothetical protein [Thermoproteota archaeon]
MPHNNSKINELEDRIKNLLLGNPDLAQQLIDNILDSGLFAVNKQKSDLITATECLLVTKALQDLSNNAQKSSFQTM